MAALTRSAVERATPKGAPYRLWDARVPGLFLRVQPSGVKTYNVQWSRASSKSLGRHPALTLDGARRQALAILNDAASASDGVPEAVKQRATVSTLKDFVQREYAPWAEQNLERGEEAVARIQRVYGSLWSLRLADVDQKRVEDVLTARKKDGTARATINRDLGTLKAALAKAVEWGFLAGNPLRSIKPGRVDSAGVVRYLTKPEEARLRKALDARDKALVAARSRTLAGGRKQHAALQALPKGAYADHLTPLVLVALNTGCRRGELLQLTWSDVDLARRTLTVRAATAKSGKTRHVPLNREAVDVLRSWRKRGDQGRVFPVDDPKKAWGALLEDAKIANFRFHDLRHHFASKLVMAGVDLNTVRELLGHGDIKMTLRYAHLAPEHKAAAVELLVG